MDHIVQLVAMVEQSDRDHNGSRYRHGLCGNSRSKSILFIEMQAILPGVICAITSNSLKLQTCSKQ
ncbi:hypothetical protein FRX31_019331 [Thalictrum thalictroides]|uniref:Uncharacterized protein n=1 Tax=Thalictrum thalictroides TaxID=46969 RepID=A0A7J6W3I3_THATH|nr:hypothetical protein FRX31_019331 [Thalictrum thalictroides]